MIDQNANKKQSSSLNTLCVLTIVGSVLILLKGLISYSLLEASNGDRSDGTIAFINVVYLLEFLSCVGAIVGASLMMGGKKTGFRVYQISSILYITMTAAFAFFWFFSIVGILIGLLQIVYLIPCILFLALYTRHAKTLS